MAEKKTIVVNGGANGGRLAPEPAATAGDELERARDDAASGENGGEHSVARIGQGNGNGD